MRILRSNGPRRGIGGMGWPSFRGAGVGMVRRRQGVVAGRTTYFRKALIKAVRVVVLVSRNWDPFASGEGWEVYLAEDLGILALADFVLLEAKPRRREPLIKLKTMATIQVFDD